MVEMTHSVRSDGIPVPKPGWYRNLRLAWHLVRFLAPVVPWAIAIATIRFTLDDSALQIALSLVVTLAVIGYQAIRNYAWLYPKKWDFDLFLDREGLQLTVRRFSKEERAPLRIENNWEAQKDLYIDRTNELLLRSKIPKCACVRHDYDGKGVFLSSIRKKSWRQEYVIASGAGSFTFAINQPCEIQSLKIEFALVDKPEVKPIRVSLSDLLFRRMKVVDLYFRQWHTVETEEIKSPLEIICHTKIRFFPTVVVEKTVYFIKKAELTQDETDRSLTLIPVAFAIHRVD
jgi:hypothetical protein